MRIESSEPLQTESGFILMIGVFICTHIPKDNYKQQCLNMHKSSTNYTLSIFFDNKLYILYISTPKDSQEKSKVL